MTATKYATKEDIVFFVQLFNEDFDGDLITNTFLKMCNAKIDAWIIEHGKRPKNINDRFNLLWSAVICIALEILCTTGQMSWSTGDVALQKLNRATYAFQRWQPMFFFATGASDPFKGLLPHETYRMMAYAYVESYCRDDFFAQYGTPYPIPRVSKDNTSRGWNWNLDTDYVKIDDAVSKYDASGYADPTIAMISDYYDDYWEF